MRVLNYPYAQNRAQIRDYYDNLRGEFELKEGANELPFTPKGQRLLDSYGNSFYIHKGEGELEFSWALKELDFSKLSLESLEFYLQQKAFLNTIDSKRVLRFLEVYEENIKKGGYYLEPFGFRRLDLELLKGRQWLD